MPKLDESARNKSRVLELSDLIPRGCWTTYGALGEVVYGRRQAARAVGNILRVGGNDRTMHRILKAEGKISESWRGERGGPEECERRLRKEGVWDGSRDRARLDAEIDAAGLRQLEG